MVIAIIAGLVALLLPAVQQAREAARRSQCRNNLKQIGLALHNYHETHRCFPPGAMGGRGAGWSAFLLPWLDQAPLYNSIGWDEADGRDIAGPNRDAGETFISVSRCPSASFVGAGDDGGIPVRVPCICLGCQGPNATDSPLGGGGVPIVFAGVLFSQSSIRFRDVTDVTTNTMAVGENVPGPPWSQSEGFAGDHWYTGSPDIDDGGGGNDAHFSAHGHLPVQLILDAPVPAGRRGKVAVGGVVTQDSPADRQRMNWTMAWNRSQRRWGGRRPSSPHRRRCS